MDQLFFVNVYELGSGIIIMFYVGVCGNQNIVFCDFYYNVGFFEDLIGYLRMGIGVICGMEIIIENYELEI